ncbi:type IV toxin-antitoxin system AbiEi family antitoxin [Marinobacterium sp. xm-a-152]|uniref:type IV toxin-antitoxin system AbiEi family antitoxin n=1 Tax=Marinobacterium sp. xm-a-152 TaxID=2497733 RepID=UPI001568EEDD|nr:type IV toxin-antitoxin system AbiEi family antitoxin [Marinobacterium sp. xm-a-152]NRP14372.1 hypothetical protein [Marinobacterium sp. xm-a-152]
MNTDNRSKLNRLLTSQPDGVVIASAWLTTQGYSLDLQKQYRKSRWFDSIGRGALVRHNDCVSYLGAIYALQTQLNLSVHLGGRTALTLQGKAHYLELALDEVRLFGRVGETLPSWFQKYDWGVRPQYTRSDFLPPSIGLIEHTYEGFSVKISSAVRAILECLYLAPAEQSLLEVYELMEGLNNLRPSRVQELLESCTSVKVKRLFLYLADKAGHEWFNHLNVEKIDLGKGKRALVNEGVYVPKYQITVPPELERAQ